MGNINFRRGFGLGAVVIVIAIIVALGGGVYYSKKSSQQSEENQSAKTTEDKQANVETKTGSEMNTEKSLKKEEVKIDDKKATINNQVQIDTKTKDDNTIGVLLAEGKSVKCTFMEDDGTVKNSGTVFIGNGMVRENTLMQVNRGGTSIEVSGHLIIKNGDMFSWTELASDGLKIKMSTVNAQAEAKGSVGGLNQIVNNCSPWTKDESQFAIPSNINFMDVDNNAR